MNGRDGLVEVVVKVARAFASATSQEHLVLQECASRTGVALKFLHPFTTDPELQTFLTARVEPAALNGVIEQLLRCDGVEGAYAKPHDEAP